MSGKAGPNIVNNGLVFAVDAANKNSYPGSGTSWFDLSGNNRVGTLSTANYSPGVGVPSYVSNYGGGFYFNGYSGQYVDTNLTGANFDVNTSNFTIDVWCEIYSINSGNQKVIIYMGNSNVYAPSFYSVQMWYTLQANLSMEFRNVASSNNTITFTFATGLHNFVYVRNGASFSAYDNGVLKGSTTYTNTSVNSAAKFTLGASMSTISDLFYGNIYNCKVYNRVLSTSELSQNFNAVRSRFRL